MAAVAFWAERHRLEGLAFQAVQEKYGVTSARQVVDIASTHPLVWLHACEHPFQAVAVRLIDSQQTESRMRTLRKHASRVMAIIDKRYDPGIYGTSLEVDRACWLRFRGGA